MTWSAFAAKSIEHVLQNKGARTPGIDGKTKADYQSAGTRLAWQREIVQALRTGTYRPTPVRRIYIDKPNKPGEKRPLGIPPLVDRCVQDMLRRVLEPVYEGVFHPHSYGFRPYRSAHQAIERIRHLIRCGYTWIIEGDIKGFFDHVDHDILLQLLQRKVQDRRILRLVRSFLKAGILENGVHLASDEGTPQGGILSPLLANIYLNELDWFVATRFETLPPADRRKQPYRCFICRYADDFVVLVRGTQHQAETLKAEIAAFLSNTLRLQLSVDKTLVTHVDAGFDFLGFQIRRYHRNGRMATLATPSRKAQRKFQHRVNDLTREIPRRYGSLWILNLNEYLAGWAEYYRWGNSSRTFAKLDANLWWLIALRMRGRWHRSRSKRGFRTFLREYLIPYRFDVQHLKYKRFSRRNFGHWIDDGKKAAFIVDRLSYYRVRHTLVCIQANPYTPEGRDRLEALRRAKRLTDVSLPVAPPETNLSPRIHAILQEWLVRQSNRCVTCACPLDKRDVRDVLHQMAKRLCAVRRDAATIQCKACSKQERH